jgi:hypothetical protein
MQGTIIFVGFPATEPLHVILELSLHYSAYRHYVTAYACVYQVVLNLAVDGLGQLASIYVAHVILNLLNPNSLVEGSLRCVLLRVEDAGPAVNVDALVRGLPLHRDKVIFRRLGAKFTYLAVDEMHLNSCLALMALELDGLHEDLDRAHTEDGASQADEFVNQM